MITRIYSAPAVKGLRIKIVSIIIQRSCIITPKSRLHGDVLVAHIFQIFLVPARKQEKQENMLE